MMLERLHIGALMARVGTLLVLVAGLLAGADAHAAPGQAAPEGKCISWSEARSKGLIEAFNLRPAKEIKASVESRYGGKVVSFVICETDQGLTYRMAVFLANGNVTFVTEPAQ